MLIGTSPGGLVGVRRESNGAAGGGPAGGGICAGPAYGFVMYDTSDVIDDIGSRSPDLSALLAPPSLPVLGDLGGERRFGPLLLSALIVRVLELLSPDFGLTELTGG